MKVSDVFSELVYGELSAHALAMEGVLSAAGKIRVLRHMEMGLLDLYTRFPLLSKEVIIEQIEGRTTYPLKAIYAVTNDTVGDKFIMDSKYDPFLEDVIRITEVADEVGDVLEINSADYDKVVNLVSFDTLEIPNAVDTNALFITYQAKHPVLMSEDSEVLLPMYLVPALCSYIGYRVYSGGTVPEHVNKGVELLNKYEMLCSQMDILGMVNSSMSIVNPRPELNGWI